MAEFKLGRIRFVWKSTWATSTTYYKDDVVTYGGKLYICVIGHDSSADFFTDFNIVPPKWNIMADGQDWLGNWEPQREYIPDNIVRYGGRIYICLNKHTSAVDSTTGLEADLVNWEIFAEGLDFQGDWATSYDYKINDLVKYGGSTYVCNEAHISASTTSAGLEDDQSKWTIFNQGFDWKGDWAYPVRYKVNDVVKFGASLWIVNTAHTSQSAFSSDASKWTKFVGGFQYEAEWSPVRSYQPGDIVAYGGNNYIARSNNTGIRPAIAGGDVTGATAANPVVITAVGHGMVDGTRVTFQNIGGMTQINGNNYFANVIDDNSFSLYTDSGLSSAVNGSTFTAYTSGGEWLSQDPDEWDIFSKGFTFLGDYEDDSAAQQYKVGEIVRLGGNYYRAIRDNYNENPVNTTFWQRFSTGFNWRSTWLDDQRYELGDVVRYGDNSYVCIAGHQSEGDDGSSNGGDENSRPDQDTTGTYWNILAIGTEQSVLTTKGDIVYYSGSGPTRLPIGQDGQVLTVSSSGVPNWEFLGKSVDVYYVAEHGTDSPAPIYGQSIDRPFKTIRYAAEQVERGTKAPDAVRLLELNRRFIQKEIVEWTNYQITNNISPFTTSFEYDTKKCERDMGIIIDAFIYDLAHGGNVKSREAALSYVNDTVGSPYLTQKTQTVASINYGLTVIEKVLKQEAPDVNYQVTNGDLSTVVVPQYFETGLGAQDNVEYEGQISGSSSGGSYSDATPGGGYNPGGGGGSY